MCWLGNEKFKLACRHHRRRRVPVQSNLNWAKSPHAENLVPIRHSSSEDKCLTSRYATLLTIGLTYFFGSCMKPQYCAGFADAMIDLERFDTPIVQRRLGAAEQIPQLVRSDSRVRVSNEDDAARESFGKTSDADVERGARTLVDQVRSAATSRAPGRILTADHREWRFHRSRRRSLNYRARSPKLRAKLATSQLRATLRKRNQIERGSRK